MRPFVHLHTHSAYSLAEGAIHVPRLSALCGEYAMPAVAVTDSGNLFCALEASETLSAAGIQPIIGIELPVVVSGADLRTRDGRLPSVVLLAQSETGYRRLMALASKAYLDPAVDGEVCVAVDEICHETHGLIVLSGGPDGPLDLLVAADREGDAAHLLDTASAAFPARLYLELQRHVGADGADRDGRYVSEPWLLEQAFARDLPIVATNNVYFPSKADHAAHDALLCIATGRYISESDRRQVSDQHYFKTSEEMTALFADLPEAIDATVEIAKRCAFRPHTSAPILPRFEDGEAGEAAALRQMAEAGLRSRLSSITPAAPEQAYWDRLERELGIIERMGFPGYFLIVSDFIQWAKAQNIPVGPGRGSGAGSLVAYALTITDLDPLRFNLLFERFLNPERVSMPDFDIDFCQDRRDEVIGYVRDRYGADRVAQIITFGKLQARAVLRDVGRVLQMPFGQVDRLCKMVPNNPANPCTLEEAIKGEPRFAEERSRDEAVGSLLDTALRLEGLYRHASTHAAGVVIGDRPLHELVPLYRDPRADMPATQFNMKWVEPAGLVKFDFLGLKTLTVIQRAIDYLSGAGTTVDIDAVPLDDAATFEMLARGDSVGVFQLESSGMRSVLKGLHADCLEDIIALVSLYRPGPMDNIPTYIDRKLGREEPDYLHPLLSDVLEETYGVIIYQEQVMQIAQILAGYSLGEADLLRRAMGKKKKEEMDKQRIRFVDGARERDVDPQKAESIFDLVAKFAGYGFNKSHAAAYAWVSYQTAYLKANHAAAFYAASMSLDKALTDKLAVFVSDARHMGVAVLAPSINRSEADFALEGDAVRYGLSAIKNVAGEAMGVVAEERKRKGDFSDLFDVFERIDARVLGKRSVEQLARAGAFDEFGVDRRFVLENAEFLLRYSAAVAEERTSDQGGLFGGGGASELARPTLRSVPPWPEADRLEEERAALGFYLTGHPLDAYEEVLAGLNIVTADKVGTLVGEGERRSVSMAGVVRDVTRRRSRSGKPFCWILMSDRRGEFELTAFSELIEQAGDLLTPGTRVCATVTVEERQGTVRLTAERLRPLDRLGASPETACGFEVLVRDAAALGSLRDRLASVSTGKDEGKTVDLVFLLPHLEMDCEVEVRTSVAAAAPAELRGLIRSVAGIERVRQLQ